MPNKGTILVIEDDHQIRVVLRAALEGAGYVVASATNGAMALELLSLMELPLVILLDVSMPIMSGDQFLKVFGGNPDHRSVPVIQMSSDDGLKLPGVVKVVSKPLDLEHLLDLVKQFGEGRGGS